MPLPERPKGNSDKYLNVPPDSSVEGVFLGKPSFFYRIYKDGKYQYSDTYQEGYSTRFQLNFVVRESDGRLQPKIFEGSGTFYDKLQEFSASYDVERTWVRINRKGAMKDTRWDFLPLPDHKVTDEQKEVLDKAELHELRGAQGASFQSFEDSAADAFL